MQDTINQIITETRTALRESILIENKVIQDNLLSVLANTKYLEHEIEKNFDLKKKKKKPKEELEELEIKKVKRRVPKWKEKKNQMNYKILKAFIDLSNNGKHSVNVISLERYLDLKDPKKFLGHYNQLKTISAKNHGKVFSENNGQINLWEPIEDFIIKSFETKI